MRRRGAAVKVVSTADAWRALFRAEREAWERVVGVRAAFQSRVTGMSETYGELVAAVKAWERTARELAESRLPK
jgi:hypothetical protein